MTYERRKVIFFYQVVSLSSIAEISQEALVFYESLPHNSVVQMAWAVHTGMRILFLGKYIYFFRVTKPFERKR